MTVDISVTFCSRGRPADLEDTLWGLWSLADEPDRLEAIVAVDPDDRVTLDVGLVLPVAARLWVAPERYGYQGLHHYLNALAKQARGKWLMWWNDDARMQTHGWDTVIRSAPEGVLWPQANHVQHANIFPIWPKRWSDAAGMVTPTMHMDTWLQHVGEALNRHHKVPIEVVHDRYDVTGNHYDQTYREGREPMGSEGMSPDWPPPHQVFFDYLTAVQGVLT